MANANLIFSGALLLVLIFSYGIISTEERLLKSTERNKKCGNLESENNINSRRNILEHAEYYGPIPVVKSPSVADVSAQNVFRPLTPGHSHGPGVARVSAESDDYRPTTPGHSPGVGNKLEHAEYYADVSEEKVFRPLIPGHGPGVPRVSSESDGFRPTTPGHSPGVGNKSKHSEYYELNPVGESSSPDNVSTGKVYRPLIPGNSPGVPTVSGERDDFRPTTPGHSPGAGHSVGPTSEDQN
ncbi:Precursor of CEP9 [Melia azedarach]|uniref:Precursor of CEP9 n=1 Tax=Melia azedarach TaxID=155640 RepID=A0ACC1WS35_MELAZ|nr:Precursor of CEP9 [Melia azedarach]